MAKVKDTAKAPATLSTSHVHQESPEQNKPAQYEIEDAANTLMRAEEIKKNKKLMPHVHKHIAKKANVIKSIQDLRDAHAAMNANNDYDEDDA